MRHSLAIAAIMVASTASADQIVLGPVFDTDFGGYGLVAEYHADPFHVNGRFSANLAIAARADLDGDAWVGVGAAIEHRFNDRLFLEASFMPGYYREADAILGGELHFRTLVGLGYDLNDHSFLSLSIDHLSNGGLEDLNPGAEAVTLRYGFRF